jgi:cation transport regulator ChaB
MPGKDEMPSTIRRSPDKAQRTWVEAHDSAVHTYGEGRRAHMTAFAALKHSFEKVGDHWEPKDHKGPSDPHAAAGHGEDGGRTYGGVDVLGHSKRELAERARKLGIEVRSSMTKEDIAAAIARRQG